MIRRHTSMTRTPPHVPRRGAILLVVLTLLALFAVIGLSFVLYAEAEATAARLAKEAVNTDSKLPDSAQAVNGTLGQILYPNASPRSALYGHDFARMVYGASGNESPYNGHGIYEEVLDMPWLGLPATGMGPKIHRSQIINFRPFALDPTATERTVIDPDHTYGDGYIVNPYMALPMGRTATAPHYVGRNAPYTYADRNNIYIAVMDPATGQIIKPSYMSRDLFSSSGNYLGTPNENWYQPEGYFKILRPRTMDHLTNAEITYLKGQNLFPTTGNPRLTNAQVDSLRRILSGPDTDSLRAAALAAPGQMFRNLFPFPARNPDGDITGDVQNMKYTNGRQAFDSVWIDADLPVVTYKNRRLKPMVAMLVLPMDGRVNYNVAGNLRTGGMTPTHTSNQGLAGHEINLNTVFGTVPQFTTANARAFVEQRQGNSTTNVPNPRGSSLSAHQLYPDPFNPTDRTTTQFTPSYSGVDFDGNGGNQPILTNGSFRTTYTYSGDTFGCACNANVGERTTDTTSPGTLYNPYHWTPRSISGAATAGVGNPYPIVDARRLMGRYSERPVYTSETSIGINFNTLAANLPQHEANKARALLTPISNHVSRPGLAPSFFGPINNRPTQGTFLTYAGGNLQLATNGAASNGSTFDLATGSPLSDATDGHTGGDVTGSASAFFANQRAFLQGIDVNRPLADYRDPSTRPTGMTASTDPWPMDGTTVSPASYNAATMDRQRLAKDIFQRLCVACGAKVHFNGTTLTLPTLTGAGAYSLTITVPGSPPTTQTWQVTKAEYDAIRYLAQLSVNIVDYIDGDDINTPFVWNALPPSAAGIAPTDSVVSTEFNNNFDAANLQERVVFGVEKPRLVINETFAEVANAVADESGTEATQDFEVRFFLELLNPGNSEDRKSMLCGPGVPTNIAPELPVPLANIKPGSVPLVIDSPTGRIDCYRVSIYDNGLQVRTELTAATPENVLGTISLTPRLDVSLGGGRHNFTTQDAMLRTRVEPNNGKSMADVDPDPNRYSRNGFAVFGPQLAPSTTDPSFRPNPVPGMGEKPETQFLVQIPDDPANPTNQLKFTVPRQEPLNIGPNTLDPLRNNGMAVVLRRLACPYLPPSPSNPYLTVDTMTQVWVNDSIRVGEAPAGNNGSRTDTPTAPRNHSQSRLAPYLGFMSADPPALNPTATYPAGTKLLETQRLNTAPTTTPYESFFKHNAALDINPLTATADVNDTGLIWPFQSPTQLDRRLVNVAELLHLPTCRTYELTHNFATPTANMMLTSANQHLQELNRILYGAGNLAGPQTPMYRLFEVLQTKPWNWGIPHGGRTAGAINVNMLWDEDATTTRSKVFDAVMDPQSPNRFTATELTTMWNSLKTSRTPNWTTGTLDKQIVRPTTSEADDTGSTGTHRPFRGFGTGLFVVPGTNPHVREPGGMDSTLLRRVSPGGMGTPQPIFTTSQFSSNPWIGYEPMRKAFNSFTTTTDTYQVIMTVGYFEIVEEGNRTILRREAFNQVPGDLRQQFTAMIDRSNIAKPVNAAPNGTTGTPWFTELVQGPTEFTPLPASIMGQPPTNRYFYVRFKATGGNSTSIRVDYDGGGTQISGGTSIRLGTGVNAETVNVWTVGTRFAPAMPALTDLPGYDASTGIATISYFLDQNPTPQSPRTDHVAGEAITGGFVPGHPGSVPFDLNNPAFNGVVRFFSRLTP